MGYRVVSFQFDEDGDFASDVSVGTYNYTNNTLSVDGAVSIPMADIPNVCQAIEELINQGSDGTTFTQNTTAGGIVVVYNPAGTPGPTIKVGGAVPWAIAKAQAFVAAVS